MTTNVIASVETKSYFRLRQVTVRAQSNEALFKLIEQSINRKPVQVIVTPRVDIAGFPYYWIGVRFDYQELNFKLQVNDQIAKYILAYLKGEKELPTVTGFEPSDKIEDVDEWLMKHDAEHYPHAISFREEINLREGINYLTKKLIFMNGKINYPSTKCDDVLSIILI